MLFTKKLSVGNRALDTEHEKLHGIIRAIGRSIVATDATTLPAAFEQLENCLCTYFAAEEGIAHAVGFDFTQHRMAHQALWEKFQHIKTRLSAPNHTLSEREKKLLVDLMNNYLVQHITIDCRPLKIVLDTHYYDFTPDNPAWCECECA